MPRRSEKGPTLRFGSQWASVILISCIFLWLHTNAWAGPVTGKEYNVKIGFIYNFAKFVTWPETAFKEGSDTLTICFVADDPEIDVFFKLDGKTVRKGRKIKVVAYQDGACLEQSHIIFFATQNVALIQDVLSLARGRKILTIGEIDGFAQWGGVINFFEERNRLRFEINVDAARREGLKMSSQLLGSAQIVQEENE